MKFQPISLKLCDFIYPHRSKNSNEMRNIYQKNSVKNHPAFLMAADLYRVISRLGTRFWMSEQTLPKAQTIKQMSQEQEWKDPQTADPLPDTKSLH